MFNAQSGLAFRCVTSQPAGRTVPWRRFIWALARNDALRAVALIAEAGRDGWGAATLRSAALLLSFTFPCAYRVFSFAPRTRHLWLPFCNGAVVAASVWRWRAARRPSMNAFSRRLADVCLCSITPSVGVALPTALLLHPSLHLLPACLLYHPTADWSGRRAGRSSAVLAFSAFPHPLSTRVKTF